jgi:hypothetical protein
LVALEFELTVRPLALAQLLFLFFFFFLSGVGNRGRPQGHVNALALSYNPSPAQPLKNVKARQVMGVVVHAYNPRYSGKQRQEEGDF